MGCPGLYVIAPIVFYINCMSSFVSILLGNKLRLLRLDKVFASLDSLVVWRGHRRCHVLCSETQTISLGQGVSYRNNLWHEQSLLAEDDRQEWAVALLATIAAAGRVLGNVSRVC